VEENKEHMQESKKPRPDDAASAQPAQPRQPAGETKDAGVKKAQFSSLTPDAKEAKPVDINFLMDIALELSIELGRAVLNVKDILSLREGSVVELNKLAGEAVDIFVNNKMIARGEVVVIDDNFGVRVTDILSPSEIINSLKRSTEKTS